MFEIVPVVFAQTVAPTVTETIVSMINNTALLVVALSAIFSSPGIVAIFKYFGKDKEAKAAADLAANAAKTVLAQEDRIKLLVEMGYKFAPEEYKKVLHDNGVTLEQVNSDIEYLKDNINELKPNLPQHARQTLGNI
jgi:hypothetical protein